MARRFQITATFRAAAHASALSNEGLAQIGGLRREHLSRHIHGQPFGRRVRDRLLLVADVLGVAADAAVHPCR